MKVTVVDKSTLQKFFVDASHKCELDEPAHYHLYWGYLADEVVA